MSKTQVLLQLKVEQDTIKAIGNLEVILGLSNKADVVAFSVKLLNHLAFHNLTGGKILLINDNNKTDRELHLLPRKEGSGE